MTRLLPLIGLLVLTAMICAGGCSQKVTPEGVRRNLSPEFETLGETKGMRANRHAEVIDLNLRQIPDDIDRILFLDRPMRMTTYPLP